MPARSNDFQRLVFLIQSQLAANSSVTVTESKMVRERRTGQLREVDITVEFTQQLAPFLLAIECRSTKRKMGLEPVEQLIKKHDTLSDKLILVSERGFTKQAIKVAEQHRVATVTIEAAASVNWDAYIKRFSSLRLGVFDFKPGSYDVEYTWQPASAPTLDITKPCTVFDVLGRSFELRAYIMALLNDSRAARPIMDRWFKTPPAERKDVFKFECRYQPDAAEPVVLKQNGNVYGLKTLRVKKERYRVELIGLLNSG